MHEFVGATPGFELCSGSSVCYHGRKRWHAGVMGHQLWRNEAWVELLPLQKSGTKQKARQELGTWKISHIFGGRFNKRYWGVQVFKEASRMMTVLSPKSLSVPSLIETPCSHCLLCGVTYFSWWIPKIHGKLQPSASGAERLWKCHRFAGLCPVAEGWPFARGPNWLKSFKLQQKGFGISVFGTKNLTSRTTCRYKKLDNTRFPKDKKQHFFCSINGSPKGSNLTSGCPFWWREWYCDSVGYDSRASTRCGLVWCFGFLELFEQRQCWTWGFCGACGWGGNWWLLENC